MGDSSGGASARAEHELVARLKRGDETAYEELVRAYGPRLLTVARRYLALEEDAQDTVQEAFVSAFRAIERFTEQSRLGTWLHRIVVNAALMRLRSRRRHDEQSIDPLLPRFVEDGHHARPIRAWSESASDTATRDEIADRVRRAIDGLPEAYRTVLLMRDIDELDTEETAAILRISPNAVKTRLHRARLALREQLDPHFGTTA
ncbi:MAG: sigma-70 family RNA polymerase sigma factor [Phycisphaerae bacterium]